MTGKTEWQGQVGSAWARQWQRTDRSFAPLTKRLVDRANTIAKTARQIVDIGCGAGELSIRLADNHPKSAVLGLDISDDLITTAQTRGQHQPNLEFAVADASVWGEASINPDLYVSRHGVMFFDDPVAAFTNLRQQASESAHLLFSCFRSPGENGWASEIAALLPSPPFSDPHAPGPFAFADSVRVENLLHEAGWAGIAFEAVDFDYVAGAGPDPVTDALEFFAQIGPAARAARMLEGEAQTTFLSNLRGLAERHLRDGTVRFSAAAWIVSAQKSA